MRCANDSEHRSIETRRGKTGGKQLKETETPPKHDTPFGFVEQRWPLQAAHMSNAQTGAL